MTPNQIQLRNLVGVVVAIAIVTAIGLWLGGASRRRAAAAPRASTVSTSHAQNPGARLYAIKGCVQCHTIDGSRKIGPSFMGSWGSEIVLADGLTLRFDDAYVRESL